MVRSLRRLLSLSALSGISAAAARRPVTLITFDVDGTLVAGTKASDASAQLTCNLLCIFGKARQGKSTLMNVMSGVEVSLGYFCFSFS